MSSVDRLFFFELSPVHGIWTTRFLPHLAHVFTALPGRKVARQVQRCRSSLHRKFIPNRMTRIDEHEITSKPCHDDFLS